MSALIEGTGSSYEEILATLSVLTPEYRLALERQILGYMSRSGVDAEFLLKILKEDYFSDPDHRKLFQLIKERVESDPDSITLSSISLDAYSKGLTRLSEELINFSYGLKGRDIAHKLATRLKEEALKDQLKSAIISITNDDSKSLRSILKEFKGAITSVSKELSGTSETIEKIDENIFKQFKNSLESQRRADFVFGINEVDRHLYDFARGNMIIVGARPAVGKTAFALHSAFKNASNGIPVHFFSMEMTQNQILARIYSMMSGFEPRQILRTEPDFEELWMKIKNNQHYPGVKENLRITFGSMDLTELLTGMETSVIKYGTQIFYIDYAQLIGSYGRSRREELINISKALRQFALDNNVAVVVMSQLRRLRGEVPTMEDLKEAGELEQDASLILLLHKTDIVARPDGYSIRLKVEKQRNGPAGMEYDIYARIAGGLGFFILTDEDIKRSQEEKEKEEKKKEAENGEELS